MVQTRKGLALVYGVDQLLDYYELNGKPQPEVISIDNDTYEALCKHVGDEGITHYRKAFLKIVKKNCKT